MTYHLIYVTTGDREEAETLGRGLVEARLVACANVLPGVTPIYWWQGEVRTGTEVALIAKTRSALVEDVIAFVRQRHSYDCPCVIALPITAGNPAFLEWIEIETGGAGAR